MRFPKLLKKNDLEKRVDELEVQNKDLLDKLEKQNLTLQEVVVCLRRLAEVDQSMYYDIVQIANVLKLQGSDDSLDEFFYSGLDPDKDEYLN
mgnify:CR=1 FL=1